jgi:hypothetical protein
MNAFVARPIPEAAILSRLDRNTDLVRLDPKNPTKASPCWDAPDPKGGKSAERCSHHSLGSSARSPAK